MSRGNFYDWRHRATSFEYIEAFNGARDVVVRFGATDPEIIRQASGTEQFMEMLGVLPLVGPGAGGRRLSYSFWQRRFGGDTRIIGTIFTAEGFSSYPQTISGVMPKGFDFPAGADSWTLLSFEKTRARRDVNVLARLKSGVSLEQARAEMDVLAAALAAEHPAENAGWRVDMAPLHEAIVGDVRATVSLLYGAVCLVLLIAITNVAGLVLARLTQLGRETVVRLALGASVPRLLRQQFIESVLLAGAAGVLGFGIAAATIHFLLALAPASIPRLQEIALTRPVLAAAEGLVGVVALTLWLLSSFGDRLTTAALTASGREAGSRRSHTARSALMVGQVAFCVALLVLSALVVRSFVALHRADNGFEPGGLLTVQIRHPIMKPGEVVKHYPTRRFARVTDEIVAVARSLPGVRSAAAAWYAPLSGGTRRTDFKVLEAPIAGPLSGAPPITAPDVRRAVLNIVAPTYFETLQIRLLAGRDFSAGDRLGDDQIDDHDAPRGAGVAIVSESLVRSQWSDGSALGQYLAVGAASYRSVEVIGVAADVRTTPGAAPEPAIYLPYAQAPMSDITLFVRAAGDPLALTAAVREKLGTFGTDVSAFNMRTMEEVVTTALARPRFNSAVMSGFGIAGVLFTAAGLYSLLSFLVTQRTRELAVRIAVGAGHSDLLRLVLGQGLRLTIVGVALGAGAALLATRFLRSIVPDIQPGDSWTLVAVAVLVLAVAAMASYLPARRATRIDPIVALRTE